MRQIEFTDTDKSSILGFRPYETNSPRFQCSWKKVRGVCVFGGLDAAVGAGVGLGFEGCGHGLLRWGDVSAAWPCTQEKFGRHRFGEGCADGRLRASWAEGGDGLQHGVLPSRGPGRDRGDCFCAAECFDGFRAALFRCFRGANTFSSKLPSFRAGLPSSANASPQSVELPHLHK